MNVAITPEEQAAIDAQKRREASMVAPSRAEPQTQQHDPLIVRAPWRTRILRFLLVVTGGKVEPDIWRQRITACARCPKREEVQLRYGVRMYCGMCGCPRWRMSELKRATQYKLWICNLGRHPGQHAAGNCAGCGGG
jgi:hypothetical protein